MSPTSLEEVHALLALGYDVFMAVLNRDMASVIPGEVTIEHEDGEVTTDTYPTCPTWFDLLPEESQEYKNIVDYMTGVSNWCACCGGLKGCCNCESDSEEEYSEKDEEYNDEDGIEATGSVPDDATGRCVHTAPGSV
eukprot:5624270-Prymnesium_polylepis.1